MQSYDCGRKLGCEREGFWIENLYGSAGSIVRQRGLGEMIRVGEFFRYKTSRTGDVLFGYIGGGFCAGENKEFS